jgi:hypothetical protein
MLIDCMSPTQCCSQSSTSIIETEPGTLRLRGVVGYTWLLPGPHRCDSSRPLLDFPLAMSDGKVLGWVRPGGTDIAQLRFDRVGTWLRTLSSVTGLVFTLAVIAGQTRTDATLAAICRVLDDVKEMRAERCRWTDHAL